MWNKIKTVLSNVALKEEIIDFLWLIYDILAMLGLLIVYPLFQAFILLFPLLVLILAALKSLWFLLLLLLVPALLIMYQELE